MVNALAGAEVSLGPEWSFQRCQLRKDRGNAWLARVIIDGKTVDTKFFLAGRPKGPEWIAARQWEIVRKKEFLEGQKKIEMPSGLELSRPGESVIWLLRKGPCHTPPMLRKKRS